MKRYNAAVPPGRYRLQGFDYRANRWYFVTAVAAGRRNVFGQIEGTDLVPSNIGKIVSEEIAALTVRRPQLVVPVSAVLPNHVHLLVGVGHDYVESESAAAFGRVPGSSLSSIMGGLKSGVVRRARKEAAWGQEELWQRRFHDRIVRNQQEWNGIADYILWNPVNWHLDPLSDSREPTSDEIRDWKRHRGM